MKTEFEQLYFENALAWRRWLEHNHKKCEGIWLIYYKKHTGVPSVRYNEAVEEALCFGWIDSIVKRIDEERYQQKFTPRKALSSWSASNKARVAKLIKQGKMTKAGLKTINVAKANGKWDETVSFETKWEFSDEIVDLLKASQGAFVFYESLSPSHKKEYKHWVMSAKKEETRLRRAHEMIKMLDKGLKVGMK